jgi:hypothetical protein
MAFHLWLTMHCCVFGNSILQDNRRIAGDYFDLLKQLIGLFGYFLLPRDARRATSLSGNFTAFAAATVRHAWCLWTSFTYLQ